MKQKHLILSLIFFHSLYCVAQNDFYSTNSDFQFGIGAKVNIEFSHKFSPAFKVSLTGGVGYNTDRIRIFPSIHTGILFFNKGSVGADQSKKWYRIQSHFYTSAQLTGQLDKRDFDFALRSVPLYHFSEFNANPLQNPYKSSISYGANWIFVQNKKSQRTGFFNLNIAGRAQISYYNDGGPILKIAGDKRDRYYTGGVIISYHGNNEDQINLIELSYHKYTGYQEYAFDVADKLQIDFLNYNDENQFSYNQQRWKLNISNIKNGFGGSISLYNRNSIDLQDFLHFNTNVPYHPDYYRGYRWMFGGRYEYNQIILSQ
ncbi:polymorphic toxin type 23 domain-containing protein [Flavivirga abyssicola]|uniref:polymorphic toxin type 23 domain-containing protein n=1 Tax=Flavivirga abyssicola TaxID=3063533 RepID=UPI0026E041F7|nr:polymorphic toxin type 23 domain-containing protein [Flavivirga sp. MEBiC07777]WVK14069.1 polymorphic toxin type 23 domain-containing protein [Flavivirga sp. MEBiC07777]